MKANDFFEEVRNQFGWLLLRGYVVEHGVAEDFKTYASISMKGKSWVVTMTYDFKEEVVDCEIRRTDDPSKGDRELTGLLMEKHGYRGGAGTRAAVPENRIIYQIRHYSELLKQYADSVIPE